MHRFLWQSSPCNSRHRTLLTHSSFSQTQLPRPKGCWLVEQLLSPASPLAAFESLVTWLVVFASPAAVLRIPNAKKIAQNCTIVQSTKMKYSIHVCLSNTQSSLMWISSRMSTTHLSTLGTHNCWQSPRAAYHQLQKAYDGWYIISQSCCDGSRTHPKLCSVSYAEFGRWWR